MTPTDRIARGCSDGHCRVRKTTGQHTNGGCKCDTRAVIAQLEAELDRNSDVTIADIAEIKRLSKALQDEKRAHARTQAELSEARREKHSWADRANELRRDYELAWKRGDDEKAAHARTQAEAAAMRMTLEWLLETNCLPLGGAERIELELKGDAGRALAERMPLWQDLELAAAVATLAHERCDCAICVLLRKLRSANGAALDAKGTTP